MNIHFKAVYKILSAELYEIYVNYMGKTMNLD